VMMMIPRPLRPIDKPIPNQCPKLSEFE
jgi:hypothetical protein